MKTSDEGSASYRLMKGTRIDEEYRSTVGKYSIKLDNRRGVLPRESTEVTARYVKQSSLAALCAVSVGGA